MSTNIYRAAIVILLIAVATLTITLLTHHTTTGTPATTSVSSFNDGYATSQQNDCQQGYAPACAWLRSN